MLPGKIKRWYMLEARRVKPEMFHHTCAWRQKEESGSNRFFSFVHFFEKIMVPDLSYPTQPCLSEKLRQAPASFLFPTACSGRVPGQACDLLPGAEAPRSRCQGPGALGRTQTCFPRDPHSFQHLRFTRLCAFWPAGLCFKNPYF